MSFSQVISAILMCAICNDAVVKATDNDNFYNISRQHEHPVEQVKVEDSNGGDVPVIAVFGKEFLASEGRVIPGNRVHGSPVVVENAFPNRFFPISGQDPVNRGVHQSDFRSGTPGSGHTQHYNLNIFVNSPQVPGPYDYQSSSWHGCVVSIPYFVSTITNGISTIKKAVRTDGTFSHLDLEELLQMEGLLKCIRTLLHGIATIRTASRTKGTFNYVDIEDIFTIKDLLKLDDLLACRNCTYKLPQGIHGVENLAVDIKAIGISAPVIPVAAPPPCECDCADSELRDVDNGAIRNIGALATNMG